MRYLWVLLAMFVSGTAQAIDCHTVPDCKSLGYSQNLDSNCAANGYLNCPFDPSYKKCILHNCETLGYTLADKTSWCAEVVPCKEDAKYTLCEKPCFATDYASLKDLAESGKCKVVTVMQDINIPLNSVVRVTKGVTIDGGNHTLTSSGNQKDLLLFSMNSNTGLKNLILHHTQTGTQEGFALLKASNNDTVSLENVDFAVTSNDTVEEHWAWAIRSGIYNVRGKFALKLNSHLRLIALQSNTMNFTDAQVSMTTKGVREGYTDLAEGSTLSFTNSTLQASVDGSVLTQTGSATFKNSQANVSAAALFFGDNTKKQDITLKESSFTIRNAKYVSSYGIKVTLKLDGSNEHPSVLNITSYTKVDVTNSETLIEAVGNLTDSLIIKNITYHPTHAASTLLSEVPNSENWKQE